MHFFNKTTDGAFWYFTETSSISESPRQLRKHLFISHIGNLNTDKASLFLAHWCHTVVVVIYFPHFYFTMVLLLKYILMFPNECRTDDCQHFSCPAMPPLHHLRVEEDHSSCWIISLSSNCAAAFQVKCLGTNSNTLSPRSVFFSLFLSPVANYLAVWSAAVVTAVRNSWRDVAATQTQTVSYFFEIVNMYVILMKWDLSI